MLGGDAGLHLVLARPDSTDDVNVAANPLAAGIVAQPLSRYYSVPRRSRPGLLPGYTSVPESQMGRAFEELATVLRQAAEVGT